MPQCGRALYKYEWRRRKWKNESRGLSIKDHPWLVWSILREIACNLGNYCLGNSSPQKIPFSDADWQRVAASAASESRRCQGKTNSRSRPKPSRSRVETRQRKTWHLRNPFNSLASVFGFSVLSLDLTKFNPICVFFFIAFHLCSVYAGPHGLKLCVCTLFRQPCHFLWRWCHGVNTEGTLGQQQQKSRVA